MVSRERKCRRFPELSLFIEVKLSWENVATSFSAASALRGVLAPRRKCVPLSAISFESPRSEDRRQNDHAKLC